MHLTAQEEAPPELQAAFESVWSEWEDAEKLQLPVEWRQRIESDFLRSHSKSYDLRQASHRQALVNLFLGHVQGEMVKLLEVMNANPRRRPPRGKLPKLQDDELAPRACERNTRLLEFVAERIVPVARLRGSKSFDADDKLKPEDRLKPGRIGHEGVPWDKLLAEWRRAYPEHRILSPTALKVDYYKAARNTHLSRELLSKFDREFDEEWTKQETALTRLREAFASLSEAQRAERFDATIRISKEAFKKPAQALQKLKRMQQRDRALLESLPPERREAIEKEMARRERERMERERAAVPRRDLIKARLFWLVSLLIDEDPERGKQLCQWPLRDWFLREARGEPVLDGCYSWRQLLRRPLPSR